MPGGSAAGPGAGVGEVEAKARALFHLAPTDRISPRQLRAAHRSLERTRQRIALHQAGHLADESVRLHHLCCDYEAVLADHRRLAREIDIAMHGEHDAAPQASLCDLVEPARRLREMALRPAPEPGDGGGDARLRAEVERLTRERDEAREDRRALTKALTGLTCNGSEFFVRRGDEYVADIPVCLAWINRAKQGAVRGRVDAIRGQKEAEDRAAAAEQALGEGREESERLRKGKDRHKAGVRAAITWLHRRAREMVDPHARDVLNSAAFGLGAAQDAVS